MPNKPKPLPVGQRPRCLTCKKELRPVFDLTLEIPRHANGAIVMAGEYRKWCNEHKVFSGHYGANKEDLFCSVYCGYDWARDNARRKP